MGAFCGATIINNNWVLTAVSGRRKEVGQLMHVNLPIYNWITKLNLGPLHRRYSNGFDILRKLCRS